MPLKYLLPFLLTISIHAITFEEIQTYAIKNSLYIKDKAFDKKEAEQDLKILESDRYPTLSTSMVLESSKSYANNLGSSINGSSVNSSTSKQTYSSLNLDYSLIDFGRQSKKEDVAKTFVKIKSNELNVYSQDLSLRLLEKYSALYFSIQKIFYSQKKLNQMIELKENYNRVYVVGDISKLTLLNNKIDISNLKQKIEREKSLIQDLKKDILMLSGFSINGEVKELYYYDIDHFNFKDTPKYKKNINELKKNSQDIQLIQKEYLPNVSMYGKYDLYGSDRSSFKEALNDTEKNGYRFGINISMQLFNGFKTSRIKEKALIQRKKIQNQFNLEERKYSETNVLLKEKIKNQIIEKKHLKELIELQEEKIVDLNRLVKAGEAGIIDLIQSKIEIQDMKLNFVEINNKINYLSNELKLKTSFENIR